MMQTLLDHIETWFEEGRAVALATVIRTWGSSPRQAGAAMAVTDQLEISGSVSGGCVEGAVAEAAAAVLRTGEPVRLKYGVADQEAWQVGLSCGGEIEVFVRKFPKEMLPIWQNALQARQLCCSGLVLAGQPEWVGAEWIIAADGKSASGASSLEAPAELLQAGREACLRRDTGARTFASTALKEVFFQVLEPPRSLVLVGGVHIAIPLAALADEVGFDVVVVDPRRLFASRERFPSVQALLPIWPQEAFQQIELTPSTAVVMLTHDPKIDDPALLVALESEAFYIGALGSRKTHQQRLQRLTEQGLDPDCLERIHAPVGLDLGGSSPEEIALAILAEVVQAWHAREFAYD